jgi:RsiW-degrading membrane proteinase PrsW (M82 family)
MTWTAGDGPGPAFGMSPPVIPPALTRKHGVHGVLFSVLVVAGLLGGAVVMAVVLLAVGRPEAVAIGLVLAIVPVGPLVGCYLWLDRYEPEPVRLLVLAFAWGALVATGAAVLLQTADQLLNGSDMAWSAVIMAPVTEEAGKGIFVLLLLWARRHVIDGVLDGLVYAGLVGVGFAFTENILYFAGAYTGGPDLGPGGIGSATTLFVLRGIFSPFAHPLFTSAIGIGVGIMVSTRSRTLRVAAPLVGYAVAVLLHAAWNGSALLEGGRFFVLTYLFAMVPGFLVLVGLALWFRVRESAILARSMTDLARRGYIHPDEVAWLVRLPARRSARNNAALRGGPAAAQLMREYQQQAIEFAALHHRVMRGIAPPDYPDRGAHMAHRLAALRAHLMLPQHAASPAMPQHRREWT